RRRQSGRRRAPPPRTWRRTYGPSIRSIRSALASTFAAGSWWWSKCPSARSIDRGQSRRTPTVARRVRFYDLASTAEGDFTAGVKMAREGNVYYIEDVVRGR